MTPWRTAVLMLLTVPICAVSAPRPLLTPSGDDVVLETLPAGPRLSVASSTPINSTSREALGASLDTIAGLLSSARASGDPRYLGYAEAQLKPWLTRYTSDPRVQLTHARLLQANHHFTPAQTILNELIIAHADASEAVLLSASIAQVQGDIALATQRCHQLKGLAMLPFALICQAQVDGVSGQAKTALAALQKVPAKALGFTPQQATWWWLSQADIADRLGLSERAEAAFIAAQSGGAEAVGAYADWLYQQQRFAEAEKRLLPWRRHDGLLTQLARVQRRLGRAEASATQAQASARWQAFLARGEPGHERELALFYLDVTKQPNTALRYAKRNWQNQRETADFRIYARAAMATESASDLAVLREWQTSTGFEDLSTTLKPAP
ncbi:MAG: hypothetical protein ABIR53_07475 [Paraperlucidibaca sp.]